MYALTCKPALHFYGARRTKRYKAISSFHARIGVYERDVYRVPAPAVTRGRSRAPQESRKISTRDRWNFSYTRANQCFTANAPRSHLSADDTYFRRNAWRRPLALNARLRAHISIDLRAIPPQIHPPPPHSGMGNELYIGLPYRMLRCTVV